jgi:GR25 family glycosyltransferase involved in LPS biosynthesis
MKNKKYVYVYPLSILVFLCLVVAIIVHMNHTTKDHFVLIDNGKNWRVPIYCINLPSEETRREHIIKTFGSFVEIVEAVDTRDNKWQEYSHYLTEKGIKQMKRSELTKTREEHYELTPGAVGCFLSHIKCWKKFLDTNPSDNDFIFILEDDTMPSISFDKTFTQIVEDFPPKCDILLCSHLAYGEMEPFTHNEVEYKRLVPYCAFYLLNAYFITARGIKKIMEDLFKKDNKFSKQLDSYLTDLLNENLINIVILKENQCFQIGISPTSIQTFTI